MEIINDTKQGTPEWMELRCGVVSSSKFSLVLSNTGKRSDSAEKFAWSIAAEIISGEPDPGFQGDRWTERGNRLESISRAGYADFCFDTVDTPAFVFMDDSRRVGCSPDGLRLGARRGFETKCPGLIEFNKTVDKGCLPTKHIAQVQGSLLVCREQIDAWDFRSYFPNLTPFDITVWPDPRYQVLLEEALLEFNEQVDVIVDRLKNR